MDSRRIAQLEVSCLGLGCMSLSQAYGPPPSREQAEAVLLGAFDAGYRLFDTAAVYGLGHNEQLVGEVLGSRRHEFVLASKAGLSRDGQRVLDNSPEILRRTCEESLRNLRTDVIDLYYLHRWDPRIPIEDTVGVLAELVAEGKIRAIGLSEVSGDTLRRAHAVHPIAALQNEYSPWTRNAEWGSLAACRELGVAFVAFSPLGRGMLAGRFADPSDLQPGDLRIPMPRFIGEAFQANLRLYQAFAEIARDSGCTPAQLCLAWLLQKDPLIVPIPGTSSPAHMRENADAAKVRLTPQIVAGIEATVNGETVTGARYTQPLQDAVDTERMPNEA